MGQQRRMEKKNNIKTLGTERCANIKTLYIKKMVNNIYRSGEWPKDFLDVMMIALPKKNQAKKWSDHTLETYTQLKIGK
jgi:hypothetical protein